MDTIRRPKKEIPVPELLKMIEERRQESMALEMLMLHFRHFLKVIVHGIVRNPLWEEDVIMVTWEVVHREVRAHRYRENGKFSHWLAKLARNCCLNMIRNKRKFTDVVNKDGEEVLEDSQKSAEEVLLRHYEVEELLGTLKPHHRRVVEKRYLEDKSVKDTAAELHMRATTVKSSLSRALHLLKRRLNGFTQRRRGAEV